MIPLNIDWTDLELAFRDATGTESFFDLRTGEVVSVVPDFSDEPDLRRLIDAHPGRFIAILPIDAGFSRRVLYAFVDTLQDGPLKRRLSAARHGAGSLTRCLEILRCDAAALQAYYRHEQDAVWRHAEAFLAKVGVASRNPVPSPELFEEHASLG